MIKPVLVDTGPIVAFLDRREPTHGWANEQFRRLPKPLLTCEAVIAEACYLMRPSSTGEMDVLYLLEQGVLRISFSLADEIDMVMALMGKYADVPMSLADACMVSMSEIFDNSSVMTLDSDFYVYRRKRNKAIELIIANSLS